MTRGPHPGRRDRAEPLARPTRRVAIREVRWFDPAPGVLEPEPMADRLVPA